MRKEELEELPELTDKQYNYVMGIQKGLSKTAAYKQAYDTSNWNESSIWREAGKLSKNPKIVPWLEYVKREAIRKLVDESSYTLKAHMDELNDLVEEAKANGSYGPALNGIIAKGKATNKYTEHKEINVNNTADIALLDKLETLLGHDAMVNAAKQMGYDPDKIKGVH